MEITVIDQNKHIHTIPYIRYEYPNLMELIINTYYEEIGDCGGRGLCGTCHVHVHTPLSFSSLKSVEQHTLATLCTTTKQSRLACQIMLDEHIDGMSFTLINDY